jgi:hypothetical protein
LDLSKLVIIITLSKRGLHIYRKRLAQYGISGPENSQTTPKNWYHNTYTVFPASHVAVTPISSIRSHGIIPRPSQTLSPDYTISLSRRRSSGSAILWIGAGAGVDILRLLELDAGLGTAIGGAVGGTVEALVGGLLVGSLVRRAVVIRDVLVEAGSVGWGHAHAAAATVADAAERCVR